ncbi:MAG: hypothetical protein JWM82_211 [Myxococcales bacterium]|nr:hypothetical protein [Myxococcales bacterium]
MQQFEADVATHPQHVAELDVEVRERLEQPLTAFVAGDDPSSGQVPRKVTAFRDFLVERLNVKPLAAG